MTILAMLRATQALVSVVNVSLPGCPICTATKMAPAAAAAAAAALVRAVAVIGHEGLLVLGRTGCPVVAVTLGAGRARAHRMMM